MPTLAHDTETRLGLLTSAVAALLDAVDALEVRDTRRSQTAVRLARAAVARLDPPAAA
ncbi:MAG: hypothetical protein U0807_03475 [Candidatus Binatia bacterium]